MMGERTAASSQEIAESIRAVGEANAWLSSKEQATIEILELIASGKVEIYLEDGEVIWALAGDTRPRKPAAARKGKG